MSPDDGGLLLPYQRAWVYDPKTIQVCVKSRRIGITWATALQAVFVAAEHDGWDVLYTGYDQSLAMEFIRTCADFVEKIYRTSPPEIQVELFDDVSKNGEQIRNIQSYKITFASGKQIVALSSSPRGLRGRQGWVIIDEAAFHDDFPGLLKSAKACTMWGGRVSVISTHNGLENAFNRLVEDIKNGKLPYSLHEITLDNALQQGLYKTICNVKGIEWTAEAESDWRRDFIAEMGEDADEELFCIPRSGGATYINRPLIDAAASMPCKVIRHTVPDKFTFEPEEERNAKTDLWLKSSVYPEIASRFDPSRFSYIGGDFGRRSDMSAFALGQVDEGGVLRAHVMVELRNMPIDQQTRILGALAAHVPKFGRMALDATGNGLALAEAMQQKYGKADDDSGGLAEAIVLSEKWYAENLPYLKGRFENQKIAIPHDAEIKGDVSMFQVINGVPKLPRLRQKGRVPDQTSTNYRHGDAGVALALLDYAARNGGCVFGFYRVEPRGTFRSMKGMW